MDSGIATGVELSTSSKMESSWKQRFPAVLPVSVAVNCDAIPSERKWKKDKSGKQVLVSVPDIGYVVPFAESLTQVLNLKQVYQEVIKSFDRNSSSLLSSPTSYADFWDGQWIRQNPVYIEQKGRVLAIQVYFDEVETANPLGSNKGVYKMAMFYWSLLNLPIHLRSNLKSIQLLGCIPADFVKKHGPAKFLRPLVEDLIKFQKGMELKIRWGISKWHLVLGNFCGDMPASNLMGGV